jgi:hypothetical protein
MPATATPGPLTVLPSGEQYIVAFGVLLGTGVAARLELGHRIRAP